MTDPAKLAERLREFAAQSFCAEAERDLLREAAAALTDQIFYERIWRDFVSLQDGNAQGVCARVEEWYRAGKPTDRYSAGIEAQAKTLAARHPLISVDHQGCADIEALQAWAFEALDFLRALTDRYAAGLEDAARAGYANGYATAVETAAQVADQFNDPEAVATIARAIRALIPAPPAPDKGREGG